MAGNDKLWRELLERVEQLDDAYAKVGVLGDAGSEQVAIAAAHEFGTKDGRLPERSFIRATFLANEKAHSALTVKLARKILDGTLDPVQALVLLGDWAMTEIKKFITSNKVEPPTTVASIHRKNIRVGQPADAKSTTLVDSHDLLKSINYAVVYNGIESGSLAATFGGGESDDGEGGEE